MVKDPHCVLVTWFRTVLEGKVTCFLNIFKDFSDALWWVRLWSTIIVKDTAFRARNLEYDVLQICHSISVGIKTAILNFRFEQRLMKFKFNLNIFVLHDCSMRNGK